MTVEEIKTRKEKAISLLNTHADKYRVLYSDISKIDITSDSYNEDLANIDKRRNLLVIESESIHNQLNMLDELASYINAQS